MIEYHHLNHHLQLSNLQIIISLNLEALFLFSLTHCVQKSQKPSLTPKSFVSNSLLQVLSPSL